MSGLPDPGAAFARLADIAEHVETYHGIALEHFNAAEELERLGEPAKAEAALIVCGIATLASATAEALAERDLDAPDADDAATGERLALACRAVRRALGHLPLLAGPSRATDAQVDRLARHLYLVENGGPEPWAEVEERSQDVWRARARRALAAAEEEATDG